MKLLIVLLLSINIAIAEEECPVFEETYESCITTIRRGPDTPKDYRVRVERVDGDYHFFIRNSQGVTRNIVRPDRVVRFQFDEDGRFDKRPSHSSAFCQNKMLNIHNMIFVAGENPVIEKINFWSEGATLFFEMWQNGANHVKVKCQ